MILIISRLTITNNIYLFIFIKNTQFKKKKREYKDTNNNII